MRSETGTVCTKRGTLMPPPILRTLPIYGVSTNEPGFFIWRYGCAETDVSPTLFNFNPGFGKSSSVPDLVARPCHSKMRSGLPTTVVSTGCRNETCLIKLGHEHDSSLGACYCPKWAAVFMPHFDRERFVPAICTHSRFGKCGTLLAVDCKKGLSACKFLHLKGEIRVMPQHWSCSLGQT